MSRLQLRYGWPQAVAATATVIAAVAVVAASSWDRDQTPGRLAITGAIMFVFALALGTRGLVGASGFVILAAALFTTAGIEEPAWIRSAAVGVLWFVAAQLAWDSIERRDGVGRTSAYTSRRIDETTSVIILSLVVTGAVFALSTAAPARTVFVIGLSLLGIAVGLLITTRGLRTPRGDD